MQTPSKTAKIKKTLQYAYLVFTLALVVLTAISFATNVKIPRIQVQRIDPLKPACIINAQHKGQIQITVLRTYLHPNAKNTTITITNPETNKTIATWKTRIPPGTTATITTQTTAKCVLITVYVEGKQADQLQVCQNTQH